MSYTKSEQKLRDLCFKKAYEKALSYALKDGLSWEKIVFLLSESNSMLAQKDKFWERNNSYLEPHFDEIFSTENADLLLELYFHQRTSRVDLIKKVADKYPKALMDAVRHDKSYLCFTYEKFSQRQDRFNELSFLTDHKSEELRLFYKALMGIHHKAKRLYEEKQEAMKQLIETGITLWELISIMGIQLCESKARIINNIEFATDSEKNHYLINIISRYSYILYDFLYSTCSKTAVPCDLMEFERIQLHTILTYNDSKYDSICNIINDLLIKTDKWKFYIETVVPTFSYDDNYQISVKKGEIVLTPISLQKRMAYDRDRLKYDTLTLFLILTTPHPTFEEFKQDNLSHGIVSEDFFTKYIATIEKETISRIFYYFYGIDPNVVLNNKVGEEEAYLDEILSNICMLKMNRTKRFNEPFEAIIKEGGNHYDAIFRISNPMNPAPYWQTPCTPYFFRDISKNMDGMLSDKKIENILDCISSDIVREKPIHPENASDFYKKPLLKFKDGFIVLPFTLTDTALHFVLGDALIRKIAEKKDNSRKGATSIVDDNLAHLFQKSGFHAKSGILFKDKNSNKIVRESDVIAFKDNVFIIIENKSSTNRTDMEKMYQHRRFMLKKGAEQVKSTISFLQENGLEDLCNELEISPPSNPVFFPLIVSTSLEDDGVVDDVHKISILELTMLLVGDYSLSMLEFDKINEILLRNIIPGPHLDAYFTEIQDSCEPLYTENKVDAEGLIEHIKNRTVWKKNYENMRCDNPEVFDYKLK